MIKFKQYLIEKTMQVATYIAGTENQTRLWENPSNAELEHLLATAEHHEARCVVLNGKLYIWDAGAALHASVAEGLGFKPRDMSYEGIIGRGTEGFDYRIYMYAVRGNERDDFQTLAPFKRLFSGKKVASVDNY